MWPECGNVQVICIQIRILDTKCSTKGLQISFIISIAQYALWMRNEAEVLKQRELHFAFLSNAHWNVVKTF